MKTAKEAISKDWYRYYGDQKQSLSDRLFRPVGPKYMAIFRKIQFSKNKLLKKWYKLRLMRLSDKSMIQIPPEVQIGEGFYIGHSGRIIINKNAVLGANVNIATGVTIGETNRGRHKGVPRIGNCVWIGTNAVIVGGIQIGDDVLIAPNAYVNFSVPDHSIVLGNPGQIHSRNNATEDYINRMV